MSNFLLFCKRTRVFIKYRFLTDKFRLLKFLGKFIPYFKPMSYTKDEVKVKIRKYLKEHIDTFNNKQKTNEAIINEENIINESQINKGEIITNYNEIDDGYFTNFKYDNAENFICGLKYNVKYVLRGIGNIEFNIFIHYFKHGKPHIHFQHEMFFNKSSFTKYTELFSYIDIPEVNNNIQTILFNMKNSDKSGTAGFIYKPKTPFEALK